MVSAPVFHTTTVVATSGSGHNTGWRSRAWRSEVLQDVGGVVLITGALLVYGVLQERIMTIGFGPHLELFENSIFLVLCNRLITCIIALGILLGTGHDLRPAAPIRSYSAVSFTNVVATSCQYEALKFVSFGVQTLAKSAKALPVMLWSSIYTGRRYRAWEYLHACTITAGCTIFILGGEAAARTVQDKSNVVTYLLGAGLMMLYLAVDGLTSTWQDNLFHGYSMSICDQVMYTTAFSTALSLVAAVASGQLLPSIAFVMRNPDALQCIVALSASSAVVQLIISYTIKRYGAVVFATIMTTRQFFSILLSSAVFWTPLSPLQWLGLGVVFGAMYARLLRPGTAAGTKGGKGGPRTSAGNMLSTAPSLKAAPQQAAGASGPAGPQAAGQPPPSQQASQLSVDKV